MQGTHVCICADLCANVCCTCAEQLIAHIVQISLSYSHLAHIAETCMCAALKAGHVCGSYAFVRECLEISLLNQDTICTSILLHCGSHGRSHKDYPEFNKGLFVYVVQVRGS